MVVGVFVLLTWGLSLFRCSTLAFPSPMSRPLFTLPRIKQLMADKMRLYAGDEDIDLEELERALTIVRRKMADPESSQGFLENPEVRVR